MISLAKEERRINRLYYDLYAFSPQADEEITIEPLTNSTEEEYDDEYYDIWEGKLFKKDEILTSLGQASTMRIMTTRQGWSKSRGSTLPSMERKG